MIGKMRIGVLVLGAMMMIGCSPEAKGKKVLEKYETAWSTCKQITEEEKAEPGTIYCSKISSMALEMAMADTGLDKAAQEKMIKEWAKSNPYGKYYADEEKRKSIPDR